MICGNIESIRKNTLEKMELIYDIKTDKDEFVSNELIGLITEYTTLLQREIVVYIDRNGRIKQVSIGESDKADLPKTDKRYAEGRLNYLRCIHSHPNGVGALSEIDCSSLLNMRFDAIAAVGVMDGKATTLQAAFLGEIQPDGNYDIKLTPLFIATALPQAGLYAEMIAAQQRVHPESTVAVNDKDKEKVILVGLDCTEQSLEELKRLADTAGAEVVGVLTQNRTKHDSATMVGSGKVEELSMLRQKLDADTIIFNDELSGAQQRNLEEEIGAKVVDRSTLILDIFAQRAISYEGQLQVELAQLKYKMPRLIGAGSVMSRLGGGIGTRGPGEKKLEIDKRHIRSRIEDLQERIDQLSRQRTTLRLKRKKNRVPVVALVGYTNSGKSTMLNLLSGSNVLAEDKLFATLDPISRKVVLPDNTEIMLIDTVGFIDKLPHEFINSFRSTLEEAKYADILLHIVDVSSDSMGLNMKVVKDVIDTLEASDKPMITVYNKSDMLENINIELKDHDVVVSATTGSGIDKLLAKISEVIHSLKIEVKVLVPYNSGKALDYMHRGGCVINEEYNEQGVIITAKLSDEESGKIVSMGAVILEDE